VKRKKIQYAMIFTFHHSPFTFHQISTKEKSHGRA